MIRYTTIAALRDYLGIVIAPADEPRFNSWIEQISAYIDTETGRRFIADATASIRRYDGNNEQDLEIDEAVVVANITIDGRLRTDFLLYPTNDLPKTRIHLRAGTGVFTKGLQNINVNARWGYSLTTPLDIQFAATVLTAGISNSSRNIQGISSEKLGDWSVSYSDSRQIQDFEIAKKTIQNYKKISF